MSALDAAKTKSGGGAGEREMEREQHNMRQKKREDDEQVEIGYTLLASCSSVNLGGQIEGSSVQTKLEPLGRTKSQENERRAASTCAGM